MKIFVYVEDGTRIPEDAGTAIVMRDDGEGGVQYLSATGEWVEPERGGPIPAEFKHEARD